MNILITKTQGICALLFLIAGCAVGPDYTRPEVDSADTWSESIDSRLSTDPAEYGPWWTVFEDPALEQLVQIASTENLPLQIAAARILEARAVLGISRGLRFPQQQQLPGTAARVRLSENAPNVVIADQSFSSYEVGFDATWELDVWGRLRRGVEAAEADYGRAHAGYDDTLVTVTAEIAVGVPVDLLRRRPDVRIAECQAGAQSARIGIATSDLYPPFSLFGSMTYQRVLDTQRFLVRQEDQLAGTKGDVALNLVATYEALGGGWATEQSEGPQQ